MALGFMRRHREWLKYWLLAVVLAFILLYIPAFQKGPVAGTDDEVARVGSESVTVGEFEREWARQRQRFSAQGIDQATAEQMGLRDQVLGQLIDRKLVVQEARRLGLTVDDAAVAAQIQDMYQLRNGKFMGADEVRKRLALQGSNEEELEESVREALLGQRLQALVTDGVHVSDQDAEKEFRRRNEKVKVEYVAVDAAPFAVQAMVDEGEVGARFQAQRDSYRLPERRVVGYLLLDPLALQKDAQVTDADIQAFYSDHEQQYQQPGEACVRHILVKVKTTPDSPGHTEEEARALAQKLLDQVKGGADFAEVAKKSSEDAGSSYQGGDLGCVPPGRMRPEFDQVAFTLPPHQVSDLVKTVNGIHIIEVLSRKEDTVQPLAEVKDQIHQMLLQGKVRELAQERSGTLAEALRKGQSLEKAGQPLGLTVQKSAPLERGQGVPPLDSPELLARVFTLGRGETYPEPFGTARGWVFVSVLDVQPSRLPELAEVKDRVRADLQQEKARALAKAKAEDLRARAASDGLDKAAAALGLTRKETPGPVSRDQPLGDLGSGQALEEAAFSLPVQALSEVLASARGYAVLRVLEKVPFDPAAFAQQKASVVSGLEQQQKQQLFEAYLERTRERFKVERRAVNLRRLRG